MKKRYSLTNRNAYALFVPLCNPLPVRRCTPLAGRPLPFHLFCWWPDTGYTCSETSFSSVCGDWLAFFSRVVCRMPSADSTRENAVCRPPAVMAISKMIKRKCNLRSMYQRYRKSGGGFSPVCTCIRPWICVACGLQAGTRSQKAGNPAGCRSYSESGHPHQTRPGRIPAGLVQSPG